MELVDYKIHSSEHPRGATACRALRVYVPRIVGRWRFCSRRVCRWPRVCPSGTITLASATAWPGIRFRTGSTTGTPNRWLAVPRWTWADWCSKWAIPVRASALRPEPCPLCSTVSWSKHGRVRRSVGGKIPRNSNEKSHGYSAFYAEL